MKERTLAVVLHWGGSEVTDRCVRSLIAARGLSSVIVVANGMPWCSGQGLDHVSTVPCPRNGGYAGGMNIGLRRFLGGIWDRVLLATNDVWFEDQGALQCLEETLDGWPDAAAVGPALYRRGPEGAPTLWATGGTLDWRRGMARLDRQPGLAPREVEWLGGSVLLLRREAVQDVGVFDERYFMYWEEVDWCIRAGRRGWRLVCDPRARAFEGASEAASSIPGLQTYYMERNRLLFLRSNGVRRALARAIADQVRSVASAFRHGRGWGPEAWALADFARGSFGPRPGLP